MTHAEHVHLIHKAITTRGGIWADLGSGDGAFTLALRDLAGPDVTIYSIDKDNSRLKVQEELFNNQFQQTHITFTQADFTQTLDFPPLDGVVMANSLHYVKDQTTFLKKLQKYLKPQASLVLIEYNTDEGNQWVPYPVSYQRFVELAKESGFVSPELLERIPSTYWDEMYCAKASYQR